MGLTLRILWLPFLLACSQWLGAARAGEGDAPAAPAPAGERPVDDGYRALGDSDVAIPVPEGFVPASSFIGFQNLAHGASFVLKTWDLPLETALGGCTAETFGAQQRRLLGREEVEIGSRTGVLFELALSRGGHDYREWFLVLGDGQRTIGLAGIFAAARAKLVSDLMRKTVLAVRVGKVEAADPFAGLAFRLDPVPPFALCRVENGCGTFTAEGRLPEGGPGAPLLAVGPSTGRPDVRDRKAWAFARLKAVHQIREVRIRERLEVEADGMAGVEIVAEARHAEGGIPMVAYQLVLFDEDRYWLAQGLAGRDGHPEAVDAFRRMARSLTRRPAAGQREGAAKPETAD
ncbi:MAG: hypothetical protein MUE73_20070 [Planctomycetes bacterium]|jgi:hypothetical protein|nr:hypothetical protein [Planctomycetota bacterium]